MSRNLKSVPQFASQTAFTPGQLRWWIFNSATNGLDSAGAIVRVGRRVYIDADRFDAWLVAQNPHLQRAESSQEGRR